MSSEPSTTDINEKLLECPKCGSTEFCVTQEFKYSFIWVRCRQCNNVLGSVNTFFERMKV